MPVRSALPTDLPAIADLIRDLAEYEDLTHEVVFDEDDLASHLFGPDPAAAVLLAEAGADRPAAGDPREVVGFALYFRTFSTFLGRPGIWLEDLFVRPEHRGRGHGTALLRALRTATDGRVEWAVLDWNEPSIEFYRRLGARPIEGWTRYRWTLD